MLVTAMLPIPASMAGNSPNGDVAAPWPATFSEYTKADLSSIIDPQDASPASSDIWGGSAGDLPSTFFAADGTNIFIRMRMRGDPFDTKGGFASTNYLVAIGVGGVQSAVIGVNGKPTSTDFVYVTNADGSVVRQVYTTPFTNDGAGTSAGARIVNAPDEGFFVDFQVPISAIAAVVPSIEPTTPVQLYYGSSQANNLSVTNKDFMIGSEVSYVGLATVTVSGAPAGGVPVAVDDSATVTANDSVTIPVASNDTDPDGDLDPASAAVATGPANGTAIANGDGTITYTPTPGYEGPDSFSYTICDLQGLCDTGAVSLTVEPAGQPPVASPDFGVVAEDSSVVVDAAANDTDPDANLEPATASVTIAPASGTAVAGGDGTITYTPDPDFNGTDSFAYTICDTDGLCSSAGVDITVEPVPDAPVAVADAPTVAEDGSVLIAAASNDTDVDGDLDPTTVMVTSPPANGMVTANGDGTFTYSPDADFNGIDSFTYAICDTTGLCAGGTVDVTVDPVNDDPVVVDDVLTLPEDVVATIDVVANDADIDGDPLTLVAFDATSTAGGTVSCLPGGSCTYTPPADFSGPDSFNYTLDDGAGGTATGLVTLTVVGVNDPPAIVDDPVSTNEDVAFVVPVLANDTDPEFDSLTIDFFSQPANGTVTDNLDGTLTYAPAPNFSGSDSFGYRACDDGTPARCDEATVTVTVVAINDDPVGANDAVATDENASVVFDVLANDFDVDGDALTVSAFDAVSTAGGVVSCTAAGVCTYDPPAFFSGSDSFTYTTSDGAGGSDVVTVDIDVGPVNFRPVATDDTPPDVLEDTTATFPFALLVAANDIDPDGEPLTITAVTDGAHGTAAVVGGDVVYTPAADYHGPDTITYTVCDPGPLCDTAEITITVAPDNDPPVTKEDTATTDEDVPVTVAVLANDSDVDGDALTVTLISTDPMSGTAVVNADNTITYTPAPDFFGIDEFAYEVSDGNGGLAIGLVRFVTVNPVNDAPVAGADAAAVGEDQSVAIDVLANDADVDDVTLGVAALSDPPNGTVVDSGGGLVTYAPDPDYSGTDTFTYTVCDPGGLCDTATVSLTIDPANDSPVVIDDTAVVSEDGMATVNVLANDSDVDGDSLVVSAVSTPTSGTVVINGDNTISYTPDPDFFGTDSFTYTVFDGTEAVVGTATMTVVAVNDAPLGADDPVVVAEDGSVVVDVLANDSDPDGDVLTVVTVSDPPNGTVTMNGDGTLTYVPDPDFFGTDSFTYLATDGTASITATVTISVTSVNDSPVVANDDLSVNEDSALIADVLANDSDPEGDPLTLVGVSDPPNGTVTVNDDGSLTYVPDPDYFGTDSFTYTATDGTATATGFVIVTVTGVNDPPAPPELVGLTAATGDVPPPLSLTDPEGGPITVTILSGTLPPGLTLNADGTWSGSATEQGVYTFTVEMCDALGACSTSVLSVAISLLPATGFPLRFVALLGVSLLALGLALVRTHPRPGRR